MTALPAADIPAPDADGWTTYTRPMVNGTDGGFTRVKLITLKQLTTNMDLIMDLASRGGYALMKKFENTLALVEEA